MTRAQQHISLGLLLSSVYLSCSLGLIPLPSKIQDEVIPYLPFWVIVSFGAYLLFKLGLGVFTFNDVPDAYKELMGQIDQAKTELRAKGVSVD
ncbi:dolichol-phosphate mannosyltransferase subunit 3 [Patellaria atrata CBS 101060]|uniref:Dolichol-phosphate mannosyltransferase subunit 3 n=1 Tax=Patellaria atrata CBS 101060 TaxID=1346257 RepID=A0A9P4S862_9PEZI|nr:dolichol-phosphate mannosyltransferase subunit 3 [Patellaria atrata CBS 101060]